MSVDFAKQTAVREEAMTEPAKKNWFEVAPGVYGFKDIFVNVYLIRNPHNNEWVLVDTELKSTARKLKPVIRSLFWPQAKPLCIILTHGHFDHTGSLIELTEDGDVPVYAHPLERPYLTGKSAYPPPDPFVGGGLMAALSFLFPKKPINIGRRLQDLPTDGTVPGLPDWKYIHTPGHSPGHISLFRESDGVLIAGDAFVTTKQESVFSVLTQRKVLSGPPKYFTCDWPAAERSVMVLAALKPDVITTGHGKPMYGAKMRADLLNLSANFDEDALPLTGRYITEAAITDESGVVYVPPAASPTRGFYIAAGVIGLVAGILLYRARANSSIT